jgi:methionyl-tRNA synthetase
VADADKLLRLEVDDGAGGRQIIAGIAAHFAPEDTGRQTNNHCGEPQTRKAAHAWSRRMLLAATDAAGILVWPRVAQAMPPGTRLS